MAYSLYTDQDLIANLIAPSTITSPTITGTPILTGAAGSIFQAEAGILCPFPSPTASTTATIQVNDLTYYSYIGRVNSVKTTCTVAYSLKTQMTATVVYGEMAIYTGAPSAGTVPTLLTLAGYLDCSGSSQFTHATGALTATIPLTGVVGGEDLWLATASKTSGTLAQFEALTIDRWATGLHLVSQATAQPSVTATIAAAALSVNSTVASAAAFVFI